MTKPRSLGFVTVARSDYGIYLPLLQRLSTATEFDLRLLATGMHLSPEFGLTIREIEGDGFNIQSRVEATVSSDTPQGIAKTMGLVVTGFAQSYSEWQPDLLIVLGDRYEMLSAAIAAIPFNIPIIHLHGGEATEGLIDEQIRHAITKISHVHFASTDYYADRIRQLGEESWRIHSTGALSLDSFRSGAEGTIEELTQVTALDFTKPVLLVTFHPLTLNYQRTDAEAGALFQALERRREQILFTYPNSDTHGRRIISRIEAFLEARSDSAAVESLGKRLYFAALRRVSAMVGNSSSGIIEAGSVPLPVVNIGDRQKGRIHGPNVIDCPPVAAQIERAIADALDPSFRAGIAQMQNPYGDGKTAHRMHRLLSEMELSEKLLQKRLS